MLIPLDAMLVNNIIIATSELSSPPLHSSFYIWLLLDSYFFGSVILSD